MLLLILSFDGTRFLTNKLFETILDYVHFIFNSNYVVSIINEKPAKTFLYHIDRVEMKYNQSKFKINYVSKILNHVNSKHIVN